MSRVQTLKNKIINRENIMNDLSNRLRLKNKINSDLTRINTILSLKILRLQNEIEYLKLRKR